MLLFCIIAVLVMTSIIGVIYWLSVRRYRAIQELLHSVENWGGDPDSGAVDDFER